MMLIPLWVSECENRPLPGDLPYQACRQLTQVPGLSATGQGLSLTSAAPGGSRGLSGCVWRPWTGSTLYASGPR